MEAPSTPNSPSSPETTKEHNSPATDLRKANVFIAISGLIGAGKSTLATHLGKRLGLPVYYEPVADNEYLEEFYKDMKTMSFQYQIYLFNRRFEQHQQIIWSKEGGVQDRTIYEDSVFCAMLHESGLMTDREYKIYCDLFANMSNFMRRPNFIVHLDVTPEESMERIKERARGCETGITLDYLRNLHRHYEKFIQDISRSVLVIRVKWDKFRDVNKVVESLAREFNKMHFLTNVMWDGERVGSIANTCSKHTKSLRNTTDGDDS